MDRSCGAVSTPILKVEGGLIRAARQDWLSVEEPLEIRLGYESKGWRVHKSVSITMRTPGADRELAVGFLFTEGIVASGDDVADARMEAENVTCIELRDGVPVDLQRLERHFYTSSSCGVCGKTSIAALQMTARAPALGNGFAVAASVIHRLPDALREAQAVFARTGGLHAAALFDAVGALHGVREDVGRHNAVDKLIGAQLLAGNAADFARRGLFVSGRASFELMQKALAAGIPLLAAVGAPSSLAVELAAAHGATLLGFVRGGSFNIYSGAARIPGETHFRAPNEAPTRDSDLAPQSHGHAPHPSS